ncbi:MAG: hypothetical protein ACKOYL_04660 [Actinomycetota bacterium]
MRRWILAGLLMASLCVLLYSVGALTDADRQVEVTVLVQPPDVAPQNLSDVADRLTYADEMMRMYLREPDAFRRLVKTLFVPVDVALEASLSGLGRSIDDLQMQSSLTRRLVRLHASTAAIDFSEGSSSGSFSFELFAGQRLTVEFDPPTGAIYLVRADLTKIEVIATDVFNGDITVHIVNEPIAMPVQG